jgi:chemotaxis protein MotA
MKKRGLRSREVGPVLGILGGAAIFLLTETLAGGSLRSLWQPTAALVVFGGTFVAVVVSYPVSTLRRTVLAVRRALMDPADPLEPLLDRIFDYARKSRRRGLLSLENEVAAAPDPFMRAALALVIDGIHSTTSRQILEIESQALTEAAELPAEVLETAAGYSPTLGILGAVLGLIHVMESLTDPAKLGAGIAVAFVATVYGVAFPNLVLLPLATRLRGLARHASLSREIVIEGAIGLQEGLNPRLLEQKLVGYLGPTTVPRRRHFA